MTTFLICQISFFIFLGGRLYLLNNFLRFYSGKSWRNRWYWLKCLFFLPLESPCLTIWSWIFFTGRYKPSLFLLGVTTRFNFLFRDVFSVIGLLRKSRNVAQNIAPILFADIFKFKPFLLLPLFLPNGRGPILMKIHIFNFQRGKTKQFILFQQDTGSHK